MCRVERRQLRARYMATFVTLLCVFGVKSVQLRAVLNGDIHELALYVQGGEAAAEGRVHGTFATLLCMLPTKGRQLRKGTWGQSQPCFVYSGWRGGS